MTQFNGFPGGQVKWTRLPTRFFSELLPLIDNLPELKLTLFCFWALQQKEGDFRYLTHEELHAVTSWLTDNDTDAQTILQDALQKAIARGTLLRVEIEQHEQSKTLIFVNTERGRTAIKQIQAGEWRPHPEGDGIEILPERPNIYGLYEQNIGVLTPMIADAIKDAEQDYPIFWIEEAIQQAVENNVRRWTYIRKILKTWEQEGRHREIRGGLDEQDGKRYTTGKFADFIES